MKMSKYNKFLQIFILNYLRKDYNTSNDELEMKEILLYSYKRFLWDYWFRLFSILFIILTFSIIEILVIKYYLLFVFIGIGIGIIVYTITLLKKSELRFFYKLKARIDLISNKILDCGITYDLEEVIELIKSNNPLVIASEKTAAEVYYQLKRNTAKIDSDKYNNTTRLYLLYLLLNEEFKIKTTDVEFANIIGALIGIAPNQLLKKHLTELNLLDRYLHGYKEELTEKQLRDLIGNLKRIDKCQKESTLINKLIENMKLDLDNN